MPQYQFSDKKGKTFEFFFNFESAPSIGSFITVDGVEYQRMPSLTNNICDSISKLDITDAQKFSDVSKNKKGTYGDLIDESARLSKEREEKFGVDHIKNKYDKNKKQYMDARKARNRARKSKTKKDE